MCELWAMLTSARVIYKEEGVPDKKRLDRFLADFKALHGAVNCDKACCRNFHARNLGIACAILERRDLREKLMALEYFGMDDCKEIVALLNTTEAPPPVVTSDVSGQPKSWVTKDNGTPLVVSCGADAPPPTLEGLNDRVMSPPLSFGCNLTDEQMVRISCIASTNHLFCVYGDGTVELKPMLRCEKCSPMMVRNTRLVARLFDVLAAHKKVGWDWKKVMERGGYLVSKNGVTITANTLASALSAIKTNETAASKKIESEVEKALLMPDSEG